MASLIVRNLDDALKTRLRVRAAYHGRSMEEEVRRILRTALAEDAMDLPPSDPEPVAVRPRPERVRELPDDAAVPFFASAPAPAPETPPALLNNPHLALPPRAASAEAVSEGLRRRLTSLLTAYEGMVAREQSGR